MRNTEIKVTCYLSKKEKGQTATVFPFFILKLERAQMDTLSMFYFLVAFLAGAFSAGFFSAAGFLAGAFFGAAASSFAILA